MKIFTKHILREFLKSLIFLVIIFVGLSIIADFFRELNVFLRNKASARSVAEYLFLLNIHKGFQLLPVAVLIAALFSMGSMARGGEFIAVKVAGMDIKRVLSPLLFFGLFLSLFCLYSVFNLVPPLVRRGYEVKNRDILKLEIAPPTKHWHVSMVLPGGRKIYIGELNLEKRTMSAVVFYEYDSNHALTKQIVAKEARWEGGEWSFSDGVVRQYLRGEIVSERKFSELSKSMGSDPSELIIGRSRPEERNWGEHRRLIKNLNKLGIPARREKIQFLRMTAASFSSFFVIFVGIYFSASVSPRHGKFFGFTLALLMAFGYYVLNGFGQSLGEMGALSPVMAAWLGNIVLGGSVAYLFWKMPS